ncbi:putative disease resistance protein RGA4 [Punica granatum]|uniref:Disease resistance protein RGA4 n=1 Tax=Punica granatum TaxID=22663 RepID=A0A6P8BP29_PUNGR|nr:putative disease resistance protein RGA4 [Punica granatum]XP_031372035.1 putative disease resistance protein RGA4 [Punica granatum]XP_031372036.1 putative disease resistance protein RGA4 [Punica granatum]XP_031372037.1 putative disease resistance protein RGA4 [Punica granatum]XP_031372038.1 putative disease resistance protein RGA4 [Punica granatum]XP_031372039.1 putative disease resistance protein RGA4 [Punica granatum]XP_031372040.1 putative disease resistance protein RGA4 [Punica granatu
MADLILGSVVDSITGHLVSLISQEIGLACGVKSELKKLHTTVSIIGGVLREVDKRRIEAEDVKEWLKKLKESFYDADDLLADFSTEALRRGTVTGIGKRGLNEVRIFFSSSNQLVCAIKMAHRVRDIRERIDVIKSDRAYILLEGNNIPTLGSLVENRVRPETYPYEHETYVVGREKDKKEIIEFLYNLNFEENVSILPIVGLGGLGKTTLVRLVFNDECVKESFALKLWVCVSTNFHVEDILGKVLRECTPNRELTANPNMKKLGETLGEELGGKKFLLVLDDVWNEDRSKWLELQGFLMNGAKGSKILVTTRTHRVAKTMALTYHELRGLSENESLSLLMRMAMKQEHEWKNQNLEMIAKEILKKCAGVPLAIKTIGRLLLFSRNTEEDWSNFKKNDISRISQEEGDIMPTLKLSYDFLPSHLKQCFAYCSLFPKDFELEPRELVHLWMAQGFIKLQGSKKTLEEVGQDYFMELLSRSFFQDIKEDMYGNIVRCKMHDLMHDLAQYVVGDDCITVDSSHVKTFPEGARHVSILATEDYEWNGFERDRRVRSLLLMAPEPGVVYEVFPRSTAVMDWRIEIGHLDVSCFSNLRALHIRHVSIKVISSSIGKLKYLRSLDLLWNDISYLPDSISRLCNLVALNLRGCESLERLPEGITKLINLRQLDVSGCSKLTHMPRGIGKLTRLQMLGEFVVGEKGNSDAARLNELSKLTGLGNALTIQHLERVGSSISSEVDASFSIQKLALQWMGLVWDYRESANAEAVLERLRPHPDLKGLRIARYSGARLSSWVSQLHKLVSIEISNCDQCTHLPPLDHLPSLKRISLRHLGKLEWIELLESCATPHSTSFPSLEEIQLEFLKEFKGWERGRMKRVNIMTEQEEEEQGEDDLFMLPRFSDKVKFSLTNCPRFSCMHGRHLQLLKDVTVRPNPWTVTLSRSVSSIYLSAVTSLTIYKMEDVEHLPVELFRSLPSLASLVISECHHLKSLSGRAIHQYLPALESLEISYCEELDLSMEIDDNDDCGGGGEGIIHLQQQRQVHRKLRRITISHVHKTESLPWWFQHLSNLEYLSIKYCKGLKFLLPGRLILSLLTTLESLELMYCPELDLSTGQSEDQEDMLPDLQFDRPAKLQKLRFRCIEKMETLPWWIQHLTNLESLSIIGCRKLKALPEWFPQLTSLRSLTVEAFLILINFRILINHCIKK